MPTTCHYRTELQVTGYDPGQVFLRVYEILDHNTEEESSQLIGTYTNAHWWLMTSHNWMLRVQDSGSYVYGEEGRLPCQVYVFPRQVPTYLTTSCLTALPLPEPLSVGLPEAYAATVFGGVGQGGLVASATVAFMTITEGISTVLINYVGTYPGCYGDDPDNQIGLYYAYPLVQRSGGHIPQPHPLRPPPHNAGPPVCDAIPAADINFKYIAPRVTPANQWDVERKDGFSPGECDSITVSSPGDCASWSIRHGQIDGAVRGGIHVVLQSATKSIDGIWHARYRLRVQLFMGHPNTARLIDSSKEWIATYVDEIWFPESELTGEALTEWLHQSRVLSPCKIKSGLTDPERNSDDFALPSIQLEPIA